MKKFKLKYLVLSLVLIASWGVLSSKVAYAGPKFKSPNGQISIASITPSPVVKGQDITLDITFGGEGVDNIFQQNLENKVVFTVCVNSKVGVLQPRSSNPCGENRLLAAGSFVKRIATRPQGLDTEEVEIAANTDSLQTDDSNIWVVLRTTVANQQQDTVYDIVDSSEAYPLAQGPSIVIPSQDQLDKGSPVPAYQTDDFTLKLFIFPLKKSFAKSDPTVSDEALEILYKGNPLGDVDAAGNITDTNGAKAQASCQCTVNSIQWYDTAQTPPNQPLSYQGAQDFNNKWAISYNSNQVKGDIRVVLNVTPQNGSPVSFTVVKPRTGLAGLSATGSAKLVGSDPTQAKSGGILDFLTQVIVNLFTLLGGLLYQIFVFTLSPLIQALLQIQVHGAEFAAAVISSWTYVRNITNILFILALIAMGVGTLLDLHGYSYKELLNRLVLMALLVNFSLVIARIVLGIADTIQAQFLPNSNAAVINNLAKSLIYLPLTHTFNAANNANLSAIAISCIYFFFGLASFAAFAAIAAFLVVRVVAVMLLLITSPIAFAGTVFGEKSSIGKMAAQWREQFIKYAFFTAILAFFLNMAARIAANQSSFLGKSATDAFPVAQYPDFAQAILNISANLIILVLLGMGVKMAEKSGVAYSKEIIGKSKKYFVDTPLNYSKRRAMRTKDNFSQRLVTDDKGVKGSLKRGLFAALNPSRTTKEILGAGAKKDKQAKELADAAATRAYVLRTTNLTVDNHANINAQNKQDDEVVSMYKDLTGKEMAAKIQEIRRSLGNSKKANQQVRGILEAAVAGGKIDTVMKDFKIKDFNSLTLRKFVMDQTAGDPDQSRMLEKLNDAARKNKRVVAVGINEKKDEDMLKKQAELIDDTKLDELPKLNLKGASLFKAGGERTPAGESLIKKFAGNNEAKIDQKTLEAFGILGVNTEDGAIVFKDDASEANYRRMVNTKGSHKALATRLYNRAIGANQAYSIADVTEVKGYGRSLRREGEEGEYKFKDKTAGGDREVTNDVEVYNATMDSYKKLAENGVITKKMRGGAKDEDEDEEDLGSPSSNAEKEEEKKESEGEHKDNEGEDKEKH